MQEDRLTKTFLDLVKIDSPSGYEEDVRKYIIEFIGKLGLKPFQDKRGNLILKTDGIGESLLLGFHLDTVEPGRSIKPQIKDGIITSDRNTILGADNKVAIAAILEVLKYSLEKKILTKPLNIVFTLAEEAEFGSTELDYSKIEAKKGYIFDSLEPVGSVIAASPFCNYLRIKIIGRSSHASLPNEAINALKVLSIAISKIKLGKINEKTIANIGVANAGHVPNSIPGEAKVRGEVRSYTKEEVKKYSSLIVDQFRNIASEFGAKIESEIIESCPGYEYFTKDEFVQETIRKIKRFGLSSHLIKKWSASDANIFNAHGIKTLNLGDGVQNAHTVNEQVSIKEMMKLLKLILYLVKPS
jgi:tripeptide aminopeptidase